MDELPHLLTSSQHFSIYFCLSVEGLHLHPSISMQKGCSVGQSTHLTPAILHIVSAGTCAGIFSSALAQSLAFQFCSHLLDPPSSAPGQDTLLSFLSQLPLPAGQGELSFAKSLQVPCKEIDVIRILITLGTWQNTNGSD